MVYKKYRAVRGSRLKDDEAEIYGQRLAEIEEEHDGILTPVAVLEDAKNEGSPLHDYFVWNDSDAANRYRVVQAYQLLRSIAVVIERQEEVDEVRAFVNVKIDKEETTESVYSSVDFVLSDEKLRRQVVEQAMRDLEAWRRKYAQYAELANFFAMIDEARKVMV